MSKYFDISDAIEMYPDCTLVSAIGTRGCGKTFSSKDLVIKRFCDTDKGFVYVARNKEDVRPTVLEGFFDDIIDRWKETLSIKLGISNPIINFYKGDFWICNEDLETGARSYEKKLGTAVSVKEAQRFKRRIVHTWINLIMFDEVISAEGYLKGETDKFQRIVETVARAGNQTLILLLGNPDYDIEQCPYFSKYNLDYNALEPNSITTYDTKNIATNEIIKNNEIFIKIVKAQEGAEYLNTKTGGLFSVTESRVAYDGVVKHGDYNTIDLKGFLDDYNFKPIFTLKQETAVRIGGIHPKHIYGTVGVIGDSVVLIIHRHDTFMDCQHILGRYEHLDQPIDNSVFRGDLRVYPKCRQLYNHAVMTMNVFTESEQTAQTFFNIISECRSLPYIII